MTRRLTGGMSSNATAISVYFKLASRRLFKLDAPPRIRGPRRRAA
jgi:hypothetical protein